MTVDQALRAVEARISLPEEIQHALHQRGSFRKHGRDAAFLQRAHEILNQMYETEQSELDVLHEDCQDFTEHVKAELNLNRATTAALASESSGARAANQEAQLVINGALHSLAETKDSSEASQRQCDSSHESMRTSLELLQSDYKIGMQVENMTSCAGEAFLQAGAEAPFLLIQCAAHGRRELRLG